VENFQEVANYIAELDGSLSNSAQNKEWRSVRDEWKKKTEKIGSIEEVVWLLNELESSIHSNFKEPSWQKMNSANWRRALSFAVKFYNSSSSDKNTRTSELITEATNQGASLFNSAHVDLCADLYNMTAKNLISFSNSEEIKVLLQKSLEENTTKLNPADKAWILRRGLDAVIAIITKK